MYTRELTVLPSDSSCLGNIKLRSLLDYFQDTAGLAVSDIEGTTSELSARGYAWVLTRYEIEFIGKLPCLDERFMLTTYHDPSHGYNTLRVFQVSDPEGRPLVWAKTSWLLLDLSAGRPVKAGVHIPEILARDTESISPDFRELPDDEGETVCEVKRHVGFHELDYNGHVNNAVYFEWLYDSTIMLCLGGAHDIAGSAGGVADVHNLAGSAGGWAGTHSIAEGARSPEGAYNTASAHDIAGSAEGLRGAHGIAWGTGNSWGVHDTAGSVKGTGGVGSSADTHTGGILRPSAIYASFRSGAKLSENITIKISRPYPDKNILLHKIFRDNIKKPSAIFMSIWAQDREDRT